MGESCRTKSEILRRGSFNRLKREKLENEKEDLAATEKILKTFVALPVEARSASYFELDYTSMKEIIELISEFQVTPFLFTERARGSAKITSE